MKLSVLFSGGKDSTYALFLAKKYHEISCLIAIDSENKDSYMFHTPINDIEEQAKKLRLPLIKQKTKGKKELELKDLKKAVQLAIRDYKIKGVVTGAVASSYQASRIQKICNELNINCFNPLWQKNQLELLQDLLRNKFKIKIVKVAADGFDESWINKIIDKKTIQDLINLNKKYGISLTGEGGEYESEVVDCPLFK